MSCHVTTKDKTTNSMLCSCRHGPVAAINKVEITIPSYHSNSFRRFNEKLKKKMQERITRFLFIIFFGFMAA